MKRLHKIRKIKLAEIFLKKASESANVKNQDGTPIARRISIIILLVFISMAITGINACGYFGLFGEASWKEEVLLHDGSKIIVKRWQKHGGRHSLGDRPPMQEYTLNFKLPHTNETIIWKDGPTEDVEFANFDPLALHIKNNIPYLITSTRGCLAYNKWGRPNPPYVIFKYEGNVWKRIQLSDLPPELRSVNLVIDTINDEKKLVGQGLVTAEIVKELNKSFTQEEFKTIIRVPMRGVGCWEMIYNGNHGWIGIDIFKMQSSYEACLDVCKKVLFNTEYCPCNRFFKNNVKGE